MIFVDSNIPMYVVGAPHPHKTQALRLLERCIADEEHLVTSAEVFQEILHRYGSIRALDAVQPAFAALLETVDDVLDVGLADVQRAREILLSHPRLSARDALHAAVMERHGIKRVLTFDVGFDHVPGLTRIR